jgi:hypothetical protein
MEATAMDATQDRRAIQLPATVAYRRWLRGLAGRLRQTQAGAIDRALEALAGSIGYPGPPLRTPGRKGPGQGEEIGDDHAR